MPRTAIGGGCPTKVSPALVGPEYLVKVVQQERRCGCRGWMWETPWLAGHRWRLGGVGAAGCWWVNGGKGKEDIKDLGWIQHLGDANGKIFGIVSSKSTSADAKNRTKAKHLLVLAFFCGGGRGCSLKYHIN